MATSPNYGWLEPDNSDLVKNGALAIRTLGNAIDTTMATMTPKSLVDAKGDLIAATANDTPARLAVGSDGSTLVANSAASTGLSWAMGNSFAAGKNKIINGDFNIWQRSTSATMNADGTYFAPDRYASTYNSGGATVTWSRQSFTAGTAPVAGYESAYFNRISATSGGATTEMGCNQKIEDVRTFAGQTATLSFWAKADSARTCTIQIYQIFGSGGSATVTALNTTQALTTSWVRYSVTVSVPSISGKTIGTGSSLGVYIYYTSGQATGTPQLDTWGWQLEAGSVATPFQTATGTLAGELAACRRYLPAFTSGSSPLSYIGYLYSSSSGVYSIPFDVPARIAPTGITTSGSFTAYDLNSGTSVTPVFSSAGITAGSLTVGSLSVIAGRGSRLDFGNGATILFTGCEL